MDQIVEWLSKWDKHLWGINASYKQAAELSGFKASQIKKALWHIDDDGKQDWAGVISWWKCPDAAGGRRTPTKETSLSRTGWGRLKQFTVEKRDLIESEGATRDFVIRLFRQRGLPANDHVLNEVFSLKGITVGRKRHGQVPAEAV